MTDDMNAVGDHHHWTWLSAIKPGDLVHRWGDDLKVIVVTSTNEGRYVLTVEETDGKERQFEYPENKQLMVRTGA